MTRKIREEDLQAFVDGQLPQERYDDVIAYLVADAEARRKVEAYLRHKRVLRERIRDVMDTGKPNPLTDHLAAELGARLARRARPVRWQQIAAAALVFVVGWGSHAVYQEYNPWRLPPMVNGAAKAHQIFAEDVKRPVELPASASSELAQWFSDHLGEPVQIPDLGNIGLQFVGGRLLSTEHGVLAQMLYEDNRGRRMTLYLSPEESDAESEVRVVHVDGFTAGYWKGEALVYTIVAETPTEQLLAIATEIANK